VIEIDQLCARFEQAWIEGTSPTIEDFLSGCPQEQRVAVLRESLIVEWELLGEAGQPIDPESYCDRFPELDSYIRVGLRHREQDSLGLEFDLAGRRDFEGPDLFRPSHEAELDSLPEIGERYELNEEIARGGMGSILRAHDKLLRRDLAVKVLLESQYERDGAVKRFMNWGKSGTADPLSR
jgi:hypothetical protein